MPFTIISSDTSDDNERFRYATQEPDLRPLIGFIGGSQGMYADAFALKEKVAALGPGVFSPHLGLQLRALLHSAFASLVSNGFVDGQRRLPVWTIRPR